MGEEVTILDLMDAKTYNGEVGEYAEVEFQHRMRQLATRKDIELA